MPTAARVVAAVLMALLGYFVSEQIKLVMPEGTGFGWFSTVNTVIGALCGWIITGSRAGRGYVSGINHGVTGVVALVFWGLFVQGANRMVEEALARRFDGPMEAFADIFQNIWDYMLFMADSRVIIPLIVGALVIGFLTEMAAKAWK